MNGRANDMTDERMGHHHLRKEPPTTTRTINAVPAARIC